MKDVSAVISLSPYDILWRLPLADGLLYQREHWIAQGFELIRVRKATGTSKPARCYFR